MVPEDNFGRDGSFYHIPKDQYEIIQKILNGENVEGITTRTTQKLQEKVQEIEQMSGHPFSQTVRPGLSNYSDVQIGKVDDTVAHHEKELKRDNAEIKDRIRTEAQPNIADFSRVAVKGAVIGGSIRFATKIYGKYKGLPKNKLFQEKQETGFLKNDNHFKGGEKGL
ncbi:hypothetical protein, partial [Nostoc sp.]|uniref:hypothetical protein n=1 Tax=Nostoc sp. TaxID=1180 RepID=UPI002FF89D79